MAENTSKRKAKKKHTKEQERLMSVLKAVCIIAVLLVLLVIAAQRFGNITFSSVGDYFSTLIDGTKSGDGYPYYFEGTNVQLVEPIGSDLLVIADDGTFVLDSTARQLGVSRHAFSSPYVDSISGRALLLDVGEYAYRVQSKTKILYEGTFPQRLLTGALSKNGAIALASRGESSQSMLTVFNKNRAEVFKWNCATENIIAVALSDKGDRAAVSVIGAKDGELYSKVYIFDFDFAEPLASFSFDTAVSGVQFLSGERLLITGNHVFTLVQGTETVFNEDLSLNTLSGVYCDDSHYAVAVFSKYGSAASKIVQAYNRKGELLFQTQLEESVKAVSCDAGHVSVLTDRYLYNYDHAGVQVGKASVHADSIKPLTDGKNTYVYGLSGITCFRTDEIVSSETSTETTTPPTESN